MIFSNNNNITNCNIKNKPYTTSFGSTPLFKVKLKKLVNDQYKSVDAYFSKLNPAKKADIEAIKHLKEHYQSSETGYQIVRHFLDRDNPFLGYYAIEIIDKSLPLCKKILGLVEADKIKKVKPNEIFFIKNMQTDPLHMFTPQNPLREYKGVGENLLYGICKLAEKVKASKVEFISTADGFYDHLNVKQRVLFREISKLKEFTEHIASKYQQ